AALQHMQNDVTLWGGNFSHTSDDGFVRGLTSLFDVVGTIPKPTAVVLFSAMKDVPYEEDFRNLAALAAASRSVVYPVDIRGLDPIDPRAPASRANADPFPPLRGVRGVSSEADRASADESDMGRQSAHVSRRGCG